jgi:hypothetical protein
MVPEFSGQAVWVNQIIMDVSFSYNKHASPVVKWNHTMTNNQCPRVINVIKLRVIEIPDIALLLGELPE